MVGATIGESRIGSCRKVSELLSRCSSRLWLIESQTVGTQTTQ